MRNKTRLSAVTLMLLLAVLAAACGGGEGRGRGVGAADRSTGTDGADAGATGAEETTDGALQGGAEGGAPAPGDTSAGQAASAGQAKGSGSRAGPSGSAAGAAPAAESQDIGSTVGVTPTEVVYGQHYPQSGAVGAAAENPGEGAAAYIKKVNDAGGVHGRKIRFVTADDGYEARAAASAIRKLVDDSKVFAASGVAGVDQIAVGAEYANGKGVPYVTPGFSERFLVDRHWVFPVSASYPYGASRLMDYLFTKKGYTSKRKIAALYVNSEFLAKEAVPAAEERLERHGAKFAVKEPVEKDQSDFSGAIVRMRNADVDTVWFHVDPVLTGRFVIQAKAARFEPQYVFMPPAGGDLYAAAAGGQMTGAFGLATSAAPDWPGAREFRETMKKYYPDRKPNEFHVVSYVTAQVFVEALRLAGPNLGRASFARAVGAITRFDGGLGSPVQFANGKRVTAGNSGLAVWRHDGVKVVQDTGFDF